MFPNCHNWEMARQFTISTFSTQVTPSGNSSLTSVMVFNASVPSHMFKGVPGKPSLPPHIAQGESLVGPWACSVTTKSSEGSDAWGVQSRPRPRWCALRDPAQQVRPQTASTWPCFPLALFAVEEWIIIALARRICYCFWLKWNKK